MANAREQLRKNARDFICAALRSQGSVSLHELSVTGLSKAALIDMMRQLQELGLVNLTEQRGVYTAGPLIRHAPCTDTSLQALLLSAILRRPSSEGNWSDILLAEHVGHSRQAVQRALVTINSQQQITASFVGGLMIVRRPAEA